MNANQRPRALLNSSLGFTLIELAVTIALLAALAVVALPRFLDLEEEAREATFMSVKGRFATAVNLARSQAAVSGGVNGHLF